MAVAYSSAIPLMWLRVALIFYGVGVLYALFSLARKGEALARFLVPASLLGMAFHLVALVETSLLTGDITPSTAPHTESMLAFVVICFFAAFWLKYRTVSLGVFAFPLVFLLTLAAAFSQQSPEFSSPLLRSAWIFVHVALILVGYTALFFSFVASLLYLVQERRLKAKVSGLQRWRMPALEVIDEIGYRSLQVGFPLMTLGLIAGAVVAQAQFGGTFFRDPKIALSIVVWIVYVVLLVTRLNIGWRGRKSALLSSLAFLAVLGTLAANYFSSTHRFLQP